MADTIFKTPIKSAATNVAKTNSPPKNPKAILLEQIGIWEKEWSSRLKDEEWGKDGWDLNSRDETNYAQNLAKLNSLKLQVEKGNISIEQAKKELQTINQGIIKEEDAAREDTVFRANVGAGLATLGVVGASIGVAVLAPAVAASVLLGAEVTGVTITGATVMATTTAGTQIPLTGWLLTQFLALTGAIGGTYSAVTGEINKSLTDGEKSLIKAYEKGLKFGDWSDGELALKQISGDFAGGGVSAITGSAASSVFKSSFAFALSKGLNAYAAQSFASMVSSTFVGGGTSTVTSVLKIASIYLFSPELTEAQKSEKLNALGKEFLTSVAVSVFLGAAFGSASALSLKFTSDKQLKVIDYLIKQQSETGKEIAGIGNKLFQLEQKIKAGQLLDQEDLTNLLGSFGRHVGVKVEAKASEEQIMQIMKASGMDELLNKVQIEQFRTFLKQFISPESGSTYKSIQILFNSNSVVSGLAKVPAAPVAPLQAVPQSALLATTASSIASQMTTAQQTIYNGLPVEGKARVDALIKAGASTEWSLKQAQAQSNISQVPVAANNPWEITSQNTRGNEIVASLGGGGNPIPAKIQFDPTAQTLSLVGNSSFSGIELTTARGTKINIYKLRKRDNPDQAVIVKTNHGSIQQVKGFGGRTLNALEEEEAKAIFRDPHNKQALAEFHSQSTTASPQATTPRNLPALYEAADIEKAKELLSQSQYPDAFKNTQALLEKAIDSLKKGQEEYKQGNYEQSSLLYKEAIKLLTDNNNFQKTRISVSHGRIMGIKPQPGIPVTQIAEGNMYVGKFTYNNNFGIEFSDFSNVIDPSISKDVNARICLNNALLAIEEWTHALQHLNLGKPLSRTANQVVESGKPLTVENDFMLWIAEQGVLNGVHDSLLSRMINRYKERVSSSDLIREAIGLAQPAPVSPPQPQAAGILEVKTNPSGGQYIKIPLNGKTLPVSMMPTVNGEPMTLKIEDGSNSIFIEINPKTQKIIKIEDGVDNAIDATREQLIREFFEANKPTLLSLTTPPVVSTNPVTVPTAFPQVVATPPILSREEIRNKTNDELVNIYGLSKEQIQFIRTSDINERLQSYTFFRNGEVIVTYDKDALRLLPDGVVAGEASSINVQAPVNPIGTVVNPRQIPLPNASFTKQLTPNEESLLNSKGIKTSDVKEVTSHNNLITKTDQELGSLGLNAAQITFLKTKIQLSNVINPNRTWVLTNDGKAYFIASNNLWEIKGDGKITNNITPSSPQPQPVSPQGNQQTPGQKQVISRIMNLISQNKLLAGGLGVGGLAGGAFALYKLINQNKIKPEDLAKLSNAELKALIDSLNDEIKVPASDGSTKTIQLKFLDSEGKLFQQSSEGLYSTDKALIESRHGALEITPRKNQQLTPEDIQTIIIKLQDGLEKGDLQIKYIDEEGKLFSGSATSKINLSENKKANITFADGQIRKIDLSGETK